ncbi:MAG: hypothetical protein JXX28_19340, partial [Deltaproteobacteria bacterium]|nr:hypothetical protein [Deltaproteobacteria bacterium]
MVIPLTYPARPPLAGDGAAMRGRWRWLMALGPAPSRARGGGLRLGGPSRWAAPLGRRSGDERARA